MADVHGFCDQRFEPLERAFRANLDAGLDKGASLAVTLRGEPVVDLWGGTRDYEQVAPWEADTVVRIFSTSKVMVILCVLMLVDRGLLDLDEPIADSWPEFGRNGKDAVTVRQVLVHRSGMPGFGRAITFDELADRATVAAALEAAPLWYEPGTVSCYHAHTYGAILGEVVARVSGTPFEEFFADEIAGPLDADFWFGFPTDAAERVAAIWPADTEPVIESPMAAAAFGEMSAAAEWIDPDRLPAVIPTGGGITNARALARIGSIVASRGEVDGRRYLTSGILEEAGREQSHAEDELLGSLRLGLGFGLDSDALRAPTPSTVHWGGYGGSFLTMDPETGISCGFAQSQLLIGDGHRDDPRLLRYWGLLGEISGQLA